MGKRHFTEEQIAFALRQAESGTSVAEMIRKLGISEQTFYRWKKRFARLGIAELRRLRTLVEENRKLKQLVADLSLNALIFRGCIRIHLIGYSMCLLLPVCELGRYATLSVSHPVSASNASVRFVKGPSTGPSTGAMSDHQ